MNMEIEEHIEDILASWDEGDTEALDEQLAALFESQNLTDASAGLAGAMLNRYTTFRASGIALFMEKVIRMKDNIALAHHPENPLFKLCVVTGSPELLDCYLEEAVAPFLKSKSAEKCSEFYFELYITASKMTDAFFEQYTRCVKGMDFNGAFSEQEDAPHIVLIHREDYELMDNVVEGFNRIVGRRDMVERLMKLSEAIDDVED